MNLIEKTVACLVSKEVSVWHYPCKKEAPRFFYWLTANPTADGLGIGFDTMEEMIEAAYAEIDPLKKPIPEHVAPPDFASEHR